MNKCIGVIAGRSGDAITSELHKSGYKVAIVCGNENENGAATADCTLIADLREHKKIINYFSECKVQYIVIGTGHRFAIELARELVKNGFRINVDLEVVEFCKNKYITKEYLAKCGLSTPRSLLIGKDEYTEEIKAKLDKLSFPVVLKSIKDIKEPQLINDKQTLKDEIDDLFNLEEEIMIEEYVKGSDCTVVTCTDGNDFSIAKCIYWSKGKEDRLKGFEDSVTYELKKNVENKVIEMAKEAILAVKANGLARVDFIVENGEKPYILEINTIIVSGSTGSAYTAKIIQQGVNRAAGLVDVALKNFELENNRKNLIGHIYNGVEQSYPAIEDGEIVSVNIDNIADQYVEHVKEDLEIDFLLYAMKMGYDVDDSAIKKRLIEILIYVIKGNYDYIINDVLSEERKLLDLVINYLRIPRYGTTA